MTTPSEEYRLIPLTKGQFAKVDTADYDWLMQWKWCATWVQSTNSYYAMRSVRIGPRCENKKRPVLMHRQILGLEPGNPLTGDHIWHDTLDNRRSQLRVATQMENNKNKTGIPRRKTQNAQAIQISAPALFLNFRTRNRFVLGCSTEVAKVFSASV